MGRNYLDGGLLSEVSLHLRGFRANGIAMTKIVLSGSVINRLVNCLIVLHSDRCNPESLWAFSKGTQLNS